MRGTSPNAGPAIGIATGSENDPSHIVAKGSGVSVTRWGWPKDKGVLAECAAHGHMNFLTYVVRTKEFELLEWSPAAERSFASRAERTKLGPDSCSTGHGGAVYLQYGFAIKPKELFLSQWVAHTAPRVSAEH